MVSTLLRAFGGLTLAIAASFLAVDGVPSDQPAHAAFNESTSQRVAVMVVGDSASCLTQAVEAAGGTVTSQLGNGTIAATLPQSGLASLQTSTCVAYAFPDSAVSFAGAPAEDRQNNEWLHAVGAPDVWANGDIDGSGVTVAVIDSGLDAKADAFKNRQFAGPFGDDDSLGHGTFVAGLVVGKKSDRFSGVAPDANVIGVRPVAVEGVVRISSLIQSIDWVVANQDRYGIRVLNISASVPVTGSYLIHPLNAAVERAWFSGIVVVVSAGNTGGDPNASPANDPFVITVGAFDGQGTVANSDDELASWSSQGITSDGFQKPDVVAPGVGIVSLVADHKPDLATKSAKVGKEYLRLSGTSAAAPMVAGVAALILENEPGLTPDQVKARILAGADPIRGSIAPRVDAYDSVFSSGKRRANQGIAINLLLANAAGLFDFVEIDWDSITWDSITWDSITWDSVTWDSITWDSITWDSITWDSITWDSITWDSITWDVVSDE